MTQEFVLKSSKNGTRKIAGFGAVTSQALYESTQAFS